MGVGTGLTARLAAVMLLMTGVAGVYGEKQANEPLKLGLLLNFSEGFTARAVDRKRAFDLAVKHLNAAGGVLGQPVEVAVGDSTLDPAAAVAEARRLVEDEGIHALVGPSSSANTLPVAEQVTGPAGIPTITPSASSPKLTGAADGDFLFRTVLSDSAQGPVLARVTRERGFDNVGVIYRDDAWGAWRPPSPTPGTGRSRRLGSARLRPPFLPSCSGRPPRAPRRWW